MVEAELAVEVEVGGVEEEAGMEGAKAADDNPLEGGPATTVATRDVRLEGMVQEQMFLQQDLKMFLQCITGLWLHQ